MLEFDCDEEFFFLSVFLLLKSRPTPAAVSSVFGGSPKVRLIEEEIAT